jgi:hypothetical protein
VLVAACWWDLERERKRDRVSREEERECVLWILRRCVYGSGPDEGEDEGGAIGAGGVGKIRMTGHKKRKWPIIISRGFSNLEQSTGPALGGQDAFDPVEGREGGGVCVWCVVVRCGAVLGWTGGPQETRREASSAVVGGVCRRRTAHGARRRVGLVAAMVVALMRWALRPLGALG